MTTTVSPATPDLLSQVLTLEFGETNCLHYGLFDGDETDSFSELSSGRLSNFNRVVNGQKRFHQFLLNRIVSTVDADARVLVVGTNFNQLASDCAAQGLNTVCLNDSESSARKFSDQKNLQYIYGAFSEYDDSDEFDLVLTLGSDLYLDQMKMLSTCRQLIKENGEVVIVGEFLADDSAIEYSALPSLSSFRQLSERLGYQLLKDLDYSADALKTLQLLYSGLQKQQGELTESNESTIQELHKDIESLIQEFEIGRRRFCVFSLNRTLEQVDEYSNAEFGDIDSFQASEVSALFEESFGVPFDSRLWDWKYKLGKGTCVVARIEKDGKIVAHYGGAPRKISYFGSPSMAIQPCDVMVRPDIRKQYGKGSLFFKIASTFLEREIGNSVNHLLGFGFPNQKAMNISVRLSLYEKTDEFVEIVYMRPDQQEASRNTKIIPFDKNGNEHQLALNGLWQKMCADFDSAIIGERDWQYIKYRFFDHPFAESGQYRCLLISQADSGEALAIVVLKEHGEQLLLMDIICARASIKTVIDELNQFLSEESQQLKIWITGAWIDTVKLEGAVVNGLGIEIPCNSWNPGPSVETLRGAWWLTAGDMDFV
ncbi:MAG: hypothetical protein COA96_07535 [SAR86 cluster bacterium]|uniref:Uncharacterized protein n=1 Tax=SAR86 cluster bacterium TaxID=2030880 RepID=A0A2A5B2J5_9GAMM|nr:MAG: hypothetical protein COA96_07535 [SAR86 cluster bacterium]